MAELSIERKSTFEGRTFKQVPIQVKKQDGINPSLSIFIEETGNTLLVVKNGTDVILKVIGDCLTVVPLD